MRTINHRVVFTDGEPAHIDMYPEIRGMTIAALWKLNRENNATTVEPSWLREWGRFLRYRHFDIDPDREMF